MDLHRLWFKTIWLEKDGIGRVAVCTDRLRRRVRHAYFYPDLDISSRYPLPVDRISDVLSASSPVEVIRQLQES